MKLIKGLVTVLFLTIISGGCAVQTRLEPAPTAMTIGTDKAVNAVQGVRVTANPDAWQGITEITEHVTPMKVTIENNHTSAIRIRYSHFSLVGDAGGHYAALPPYKIEGTVKRPVITGPFDVYPAPTFSYRRFRLAPHYGTLYPGSPITHGPFFHDPLYYDRYYRYWENIPLPTQEMVKAALVEGDLEPGGQLSGFLYFERIGDEKEISFRMDLVDATDGTVSGTVTIPFIVNE